MHFLYENCPQNKKYSNYNSFPKEVPILPVGEMNAQIKKTRYLGQLRKPGPSCSKPTTWLVNVPLKFQNINI